MALITAKAGAAPDLLEEQALRLLNLGRPGDVLIARRERAAAAPSPSPSAAP